YTLYFFFQAEDGIRDRNVTGVQTCALPIFLHIRLRTKKGDASQVHLISGDPYDWSNNKWQITRKVMKLERSDSLFDYWIISVEPAFKRLRYAFEIIGDVETLIYTEKGFFKEPPLDDTRY